MLKNIRLMAPIFAFGLLSALPAFSSTILLGLNGEAEVGTDYLSFGVYPAGGPYTPAPGSGTYEVAAPVANIFAANGVTTGEFGLITSLSTSLEPGGVVYATPVKFLTFDTTGSNLQLFLTELFVGNVPSPPAPPNSPIVLGDPGSGATASVAFTGYVLNTTDNSHTPYTGLFQATFAGTTAAQLLASLPRHTPFSGTIALTITPEPAPLLLIGFGLLAAGIVARKKAVRK